MEAIISKELLCEVYSEEVDFIRYVANNTHEVYFKNPTRLKYQIVNIYELAHKCKEWAYNNNYYVYSIFAFGGEGWSYITHTDNISKRLSSFDTDSEPEAIFKACQWILENKEED